MESGNCKRKSVESFRDHLYNISWQEFGSKYFHLNMGLGTGGSCVWGSDSSWGEIIVFEDEIMMFSTKCLGL